MNWRDANHAYLVGSVFSAVTKMCRESGGKAEPVFDDDGYTNVIRIKRPSGNYLVTIEPDFGQGEPGRELPKDTGRPERRG